MQILKKMGLYGIAITGSIMEAGVPVLMAADVKRVLSSENMFFDKEKHNAKVNNLKKDKIRKILKNQ